MNEPLAISNFLVIIFTGVFSYRGFIDPRFQEKYIFWPQCIFAFREYYRVFTSAFLHANWRHLISNMVSLYLFGSTIETFVGVQDFLIIYFGSITGGGLLSLFIHRQHDYRAYGASGGVCENNFRPRFPFPGREHYVFSVSYGIPAWLYAIGFMLGSFYGLKAQRDNIGHDAHLGGAILGLLITAALHPAVVGRSPKLLSTVLLLSVLLMVYLIVNPLFLPADSVLSAFTWQKLKRRSFFKSKQKPLNIDDLLEKISKQGTDSLTAPERAFLAEASRKYRSRADSKPPESELLL
jgi:membrane associated rhomboid family serine protease